MTSVSNISNYLQLRYPSALAADWDNVGLLLGDPAAHVEKLMTCLTITPDVVEEAVESSAQMIVSHHPVMFRPIQNLSTKTSQGRILWRLARAGVAVYSPHTAFDNAKEGINDVIATRLKLIDIEPLRRGENQKHYKIVVFVPETDFERVAAAMFEAGAGVIGEYRECSYRVTGTGTFFGSEETNPAIGRKGRREEVTEWRLEVICPHGRLADVLASMQSAHSYEEPAYDVYLLHPNPSSSGEGRIGKLEKSMPLGELAKYVKEILRAPCVKVVGDPETEIASAAVACGAAGEFLGDAAKKRADVFLTGEMRFHDCLTAREMGICVLLPGHYATERLAIEELAAQLQQQWPDVEAWASRRETNPIETVV